MSFWKSWRPKVAGLVNLDLACKDLELDFFVLFSSAAGVWGIRARPITPPPMLLWMPTRDIVIRWSLQTSVTAGRYRSIGRYGKRAGCMSIE